MNYEDLLKRAKQNLPETKYGGRLEIPSAIITPVKRTTIIRNFADIAKAVRREPKHFAKFLFKELAVPGTITGNELLLNGKVSPSIINQRIQDYIAEYVVCKECKRPDTTLRVESGIVLIKCEACGAQRTFKTA